MTSIEDFTKKSPSRCIARVYYPKDHEKPEIIYRDKAVDPDAKPELFEQQHLNFLEGPASHVGDFVYTSINIKTPEGVTQALKTLEKGLLIDRLGQWYSYAWWFQDEEMAAILTKEPGTGSDFSKLHVIIHLDSKDDAFKCCKYGKRLYAPHLGGMEFGEVVARNMRNGRGTIDVHINGRTLRFLIRPVGKDSKGYAKDDGMHLLSTEAYHAVTGRKRPVGAGAQLTALEAAGLFKGHVRLCAPGDLPKGVDGILIGAKKLIKAGGNLFVMGFLQEIHGREELYTDIQSVINFQLEVFLTGWAVKQFLKYYAELEDSVAIGESLERMLEKQHVDPEWFEEGYLPAKIYLAEQKYKLGLFANLIPAARWRLGRMTEKKIAEMCLRDPKGRIRVLVDEADGFARYAMVDTTAFDLDGNVDEDGGVLKEGQAFVCGAVGHYVRDMNKLGERVFVWVHRQPNGHTGERYKLELVWSEELEKIFGDEDCPFIYISAKTVGPMMHILGGGDLDDPLVCWIGKEIVKHFDNLPDFPKPDPALIAKIKAEVEKVTETKTKAKATALDHLASGYSFNRVLMADIIYRKAAERETIGSAITPLMVWTALWHAGLLNGVYDFSFIGWLTEVIFDAVVKNGGDLRFVGEARKALYESVKHLPKWAMRKLSKQTVKKYNFKAIETALDQVVGEIADLADTYHERLIASTHWVVNEKWAEVSFKPYTYMTVAASRFDSRSPAFILADSIELAYRRIFKATRLSLIGLTLANPKWFEEEKQAFKDLQDPEKARKEAEKARREGREPKPIYLRTHPLSLQAARKDKDLEEDPVIGPLYNKPEITGLAYQMAEREVYRLFRNQPDIRQAFAILWGRIYRKANDKLPYNLPDGLLWGRYTADLTIEALVWARDNMPAEPTPLQPKDAVEPGITPAPAGANITEPAIPTYSVKAEDFVELSDEDFLRNLVVVNGQHQKGEGLGTPELTHWKESLVGKMVILNPVLWRGKKAYRVLIGGNHKAWLDALQAVRLWNMTGGKSRQAMVRTRPGFPCTLSAAVVLQ